MKRENIILTGFMGTGKSAVGKLLARRLNYNFLDTDQLVEERSGLTIAEIFEREGETAFRALESEVAQEIAQEQGAVIATGGRLMLDYKNADLLGSTGFVFCLTASPDEIVKRLQDDSGKRPLLDVPHPQVRIRELLAERSQAYDQFPQIVTDRRSVEDIAREIELVMKNRRVISVSHPQGQYDVFVGPDLLSSLHDLANLSSPVAVITDSNVGPLYGDRCGADMTILIPAGERFKTLATVNEIYGKLLSAGFDRQGTIIALGGGVVGDIAGFVAATFMRGVKFVQAPTSLLAMVDASVGGKTGVDLPQGKNLVGAFKQPGAVLADLLTLSTLPEAEFVSGMAEVIKGGVIADPDLFILIENRAVELKTDSNENLALLGKVVADAIEVKRQVVEADPFENGRRAVLNLGHTFGHAIERESGYRIRHGECVAMGLVASAHLSAELGHCSPELETRIAMVLADVGLPRRIPSELQAVSIYEAMASDKKKVSGRLRFILPRDLGDVFISDQVIREQVLATLRTCGAA